MKGGGLLRVRPDSCPFAGIQTAVRGCEGCNPVNFWDRVCPRYLHKSEVLGLVSLFSKILLNSGPDFLSCRLRGAHCGSLDVVCIGRVRYVVNFRVYRVG